MNPDFLEYINELMLLIAAIKKLQDISKSKKKQLTEALDALRKAAYSTKGYYAAQKVGKGIDKDTEHQLAIMWIDCANKVRNYSEDLYERFKLKRNYWLSPEDWTDEQVKAARIGLDDIHREAEILLDPPKVKKKAKH